MLMSDALMSLTVRGLFAAKWSERIETEWIAAVTKKRPDLSEKLARRQNLMRRAVPDWEVPEAAIASLEHCLELPDAGDKHVLAAAIAGHADCIVTLNLRDFPNEQLGPYGVEAVDPDRFILNQWDLDDIAVIAALKGMRVRWRRPEASPETFAAAFDRVGLLGTAERIREVAELI
jgi:predicted nucleic acid-binding protein